MEIVRLERAVAADKPDVVQNLPPRRGPDEQTLVVARPQDARLAPVDRVSGVAREAGFVTAAATPEASSHAS